MDASWDRSPANTARRLSRGERASLTAAGSVLVLGALALAFWYFHPLLSAQYDDSYITYRYAWNLFRGEGLVFNPGDKVNSASSLLYALVLAALGPLGHDSLPSASAVMGIISFIGLGALFVAAGFQLRKSAVGLLVGLGAASIPLFNATNAYWALSGMETPLFNFLMAASLILATLPDASRGQVRLAALTTSLVLLAVARPEGIAIAGAVAVGWVIRGVLSREGTWFRATVPLAAVTLTAAGYLLFNLVYYGSLIPNSVVFKTLSDYYTTSLPDNLSSLAVYFAMRLGPVVSLGAFSGLAAALIWGPGRLGSRLVRLLPGVLGGLALVVFLLSASYSDQYRYQTPLSIVAAWCFVQWATVDRLFLRPHALRWLSVLVVAFIVTGAFWQVLVADRIRAANAPFMAAQEAREDMGRWLEGNTPSGTHVLAGDLGSLAYWNPSNIYVDSSGLTNGELLNGLRAGVPYSEIIQRQKPELVVDTVDPSGQIGSVETFNDPSDYFDPAALLPVPGQPFDEVYRLALVRQFPEGAGSDYIVSAFRMIPQSR